MSSGIEARALYLKLARELKKAPRAACQQILEEMIRAVAQHYNYDAEREVEMLRDLRKEDE